VSGYRLTPRALADLDSIADFTLATWGERKLRNYLSDLERRFQWLADNPMLGRARDDIAVGYRCFPQGAHLIFYIAQADEIHIIGVPHASMDIDTFFLPNEAE
jgi:toxin ParE1/3/4